LNTADAIVFEGAQGLLLDQDRGAFPHVTRSNTGLKNVLTIAAEAGIAHLEVIYVTRCYVTRHGAGPLAHELPGPPHPDVIDTTNVPNPWQGRLRFGTLDLSILKRAVAADLSDAARAVITVSHGLAMTCLDQVGEVTECVANERRIEVSPHKLAAIAARALGTTTSITCHGPSRDACHFPRSLCALSAAGP